MNSFPLLRNLLNPPFMKARVLELRRQFEALVRLFEQAKEPHERRVLILEARLLNEELKEIRALYDAARSESVVRFSCETGWHGWLGIPPPDSG